MTSVDIHLFADDTSFLEFARNPTASSIKLNSHFAQIGVAERYGKYHLMV